MTLGQRIARAMELAGTNKNAVAVKLGLNWQTVQHWTLDKSEPTVANLRDLARETRVRADWLLGLDDDEPRVERHPQLRLVLG